MSDIRKYFSSSSGRESTTDTAESLQQSGDESNGCAPGPSKMVCTESSRKYKKWEKSFTCYTLMKMFVVHSVVYAKNGPAQPPH